MEFFPNIGRILVLFGIILILIGLIIWLFPKIPFFGKLPGDFTFRKGPVTIWFPLVSSLILSVIITIILNIFFRK